MAAYDQDLVLELNAADLAQLTMVAIERLGQLGREGREAIEKEIRLKDSDNADLAEGLAQMEDIAFD
jgi:hypothetical protein